MVASENTIFQEEKMENYVITQERNGEISVLASSYKNAIFVGGDYLSDYETYNLEKVNNLLKDLQESNPDNEYRIITEDDFRQTYLLEKNKLTPTEYLAQKINASGINIHLSKEEMKAILEAGKDIQKLAVKYGTNQNIESENENTFNGYGTYVVSVNEENARQLGIKIASRKYGGTFYINNQPLSQFLQEKNFSSYWIKRLEQLNTNSVDNLSHEIMMANVNGNATLEQEQNKLSTILSLDLVEYKREQTYLYSVEIPDNNNTNYLLYNNPIGIDQATKINNELVKMGVEWRASRNDIGKNIYFELLSKNVFDGNQKAASEFLKENVGFVGMQMDHVNYIIFNDKDMSINNRVQYMKSENGEVYGFAFDGEIYIDEDLVNSNVLAHEYTHIWDNYVKKNNPDLWQKGMNCLKGTSLWYEITEDKNYENLRTDDEILSECHARIVGKIAEQVLERIAARDGELTKDKIIDWDREVNEYVTTELLIKPELGDENYISESVKAEYLKEFLSMPMKDLMNELKVQMGKRQEINIQQDIRQEKKALIEKIKSWATDENFDIAEGLSREDIFEKFGNDREIIAILPNKILPLFDVTDKNVYCGKGYFIDHMANHHPEVDLSYYESIQNILDEHKEIYLDTKNGSVVFGQTNVFGKKDFLALRKDNDDKIVFYKTFYYGNKIPKKFQKIELEDIKKEISVEGGRSSINHLDNQDSAASISARTDTSNIQHNGDEVNSQTYLSGENSESSKVQKYAESIDNSQIENSEESVEKSSKDIDIQKEETVVPEKKEISQKENKGVVPRIVQEKAIKNLGYEISESAYKGYLSKMAESFFEIENNDKWNCSEEEKSFLLKLKEYKENKDIKKLNKKNISEFLNTEIYANNKSVIGNLYNLVYSQKEDQTKEFSFKKEFSEKEEKFDIIFGQTIIPEFVMITQHGLKTYTNIVVDNYEEHTKSYLLKSQDGQETVRITENTLKELSSNEHQQKAQSFDENTKAAEKMIETQYKDFFEPRKNCANNFRHNLSVFCRKEANSPLDALKVANSLISQMSKEEKRKTKDLLNLLRKDGQTVNEVIIDTYHEAVKEVPLNEEYLNNKRYDKMIARPMYDTITDKGQKLDRDFNLKIGDSVKVTFKVDKNAGTKFSLKKENLFQECTIISSSKEANKVTLMDGNKSFYDVPRDTFLKEYAKREKIEHKQEQKKQRSYSMKLDVER